MSTTGECGELCDEIALLRAAMSDAAAALENCASDPRVRMARVAAHLRADLAASNNVEAELAQFDARRAATALPPARRPEDAA